VTEKQSGTTLHRNYRVRFLVFLRPAVFFFAAAAGFFFVDFFATFFVSFFLGDRFLAVFFFVAAFFVERFFGCVKIVPQFSE